MVSLAWSVTDSVHVNSPAHGHAATVSLSYTHPVRSPDKHLWNTLEGSLTKNGKVNEQGACASVRVASVYEPYHCTTSYAIRTETASKWSHFSSSGNQTKHLIHTYCT